MKYRTSDLLARFSLAALSFSVLIYSVTGRGDEEHSLNEFHYPNEISDGTNDLMIEGLNGKTPKKQRRKWRRKY